MLDFALYVVRRHRRTIHAVLAVALFVSYYRLEDKPDDDALPELRIVVIEKDSEELFATL